MFYSEKDYTEMISSKQGVRIRTIRKNERQISKIFLTQHQKIIEINFIKE